MNEIQEKRDDEKYVKKATNLSPVIDFRKRYAPRAPRKRKAIVLRAIIWAGLNTRIRRFSGDTKELGMVVSPATFNPNSKYGLIARIS